MWRAILTARARPSSGVAVINVPPGTRTSSESGTRVIESPESVKFESQAYHAQAKFNASRQRRVAQVFDVAATTAIGVPRSFAFFAKEAPERLPIGGSCKTDKEAEPGSIAAHSFGKLWASSCEKRKDGHPSPEALQTVVEKRWSSCRFSVSPNDYLITEGGRHEIPLFRISRTRNIRGHDRGRAKRSARRMF